MFLRSRSRCGCLCSGSGSLRPAFRATARTFLHVGEAGEADDDVARPAEDQYRRILEESEQFRERLRLAFIHHVEATKADTCRGCSGPRLGGSPSLVERHMGCVERYDNQSRFWRQRRGQSGRHAVRRYGGPACNRLASGRLLDHVLLDHVLLDHVPRLTTCLTRVVGRSESWGHGVGRSGAGRSWPS